MATVNRLEELETWNLARATAKEIRQLLNNERFKHEFGLKEQMKNASGSIMDNIAEGFGRGSKLEFVNHLTIAKGSAEELKSQLYRCLDDGLTTIIEHERLILQLEAILRKTGALISYLNRTQFKGQKFKYRS